MKTVLKIGLVLLALVAFTGCDAVLESFYPGFAPEENVDGYLTLRLYIQDTHPYSPYTQLDDYTLVVGGTPYDMDTPTADVYFYQYLAYSGSYEIYFSGPVSGGSQNVALYTNGGLTLVADYGTVNIGESTVIEDLIAAP